MWGKKVFLKVSLGKKVLHFGRKRKLTQGFIGLYKVIECVVPVACRFVLLLELKKIHNSFHVLMLQRYRSNPSYVLTCKEIKARPYLSDKKEPV